MKSLDNLSLPEALNSKEMYTLLICLMCVLIYGTWTVVSDKRDHMKVVRIVD